MPESAIDLRNYPELKPTVHHSYCMSCVLHTHPQMLTGYCMRSETCTRCGQRSDLALVRIPEPQISFYGRKKLMEITMKPVVGMKVKILRGSLMDGPNKPRSDYVGWIAGNVPVGSVGEVYKHVIHPWKKEDDETRYMMALKFEGITPKPGYCFGLSGDTLSPEDYEIVSIPKE